MLGSLGVVLAVFVKISISIQCSPDGDVRLVNGTTLQEGRLEICLNSNWSTVCDDGWDNRDARVVCRQLGYNENGNKTGCAIYGACFGQGVGSIALDNVNCNGRERTLLDCSHRGLFVHDCDHSEDVSVRCILREDQRVKNITLSVEIISVPSTVHTALISWVLYNTTTDEPTSFDVKCSNEKHSILMSVSGLNVTTQLLMGLLPVTSYNCCVSTVYELYRADGICNEIKTPELFISTRSTTMNQISSRASDHDSETNVVGGVFGFIVVILFVLLIISGVGLAFLLPRWKKNARLSESVDHGRNSIMDMPVHSNLSYMKAPNSRTSNSATKARGAQAVTVNQLEGGADPDYSSLGPDYETIDSRSGQSQRKNQVPVGRLSERYEHSEAHLATLNENAPEGLGSINYEVPLNLNQNVSTESEDYSHLKH